MTDRETDVSWHWQAVDPERNIARDYRLSVTCDLFGWFIVEQVWGRIGTEGQGKVQAFEDAADARRHIAQVKARRLSAERRIGVAYREASRGG